MVFPFVRFHRDRFSISTAFSFSALAYLLKLLLCHNVFILLSLSGVTNLSLLVGVCAACMLAYICLQMKWWAVMDITILSQKALLVCPYVSSGRFAVLAPRCSRAPLRNLQFTSDRCLIFASHLATAIAIISCLSCLQGTRGSFKYFPKNALLSFCRHMKSAVHVPYAGWLILPCSALARTCDRLCQHLSTIFHIVAWVCLLSLSLSTCKSLFMFLHLILCCPSSNCISHAIIKCRMTILISYFPCLTARFFPRKDCWIRPLAPLFAVLRIWNSFLLQNVFSFIRRVFSMRFALTRKVAVPTAILFRSISMAANQVSWISVYNLKFASQISDSLSPSDDVFQSYLQSSKPKLRRSVCCPYLCTVSNVCLS